MHVKVHYRITQDRAGLPSEYTGARFIVIHDGNTPEEIAIGQLARDYEVPHTAVEIVKIEE